MAHSFQFLGAVVAEAVDESIAEYDYDNANDVDEFCPDLPNNPDVGNYDEGEGEGGYFPSQSILPTQTQGKCISFGINVLKIQASAIVFCFVFSFLGTSNYDRDESEYFISLATINFIYRHKPRASFGILF